MKGRRHLDALDEDVREHLERETQDNIDRGLSPEDARAAALRTFGSVARVKEDARAVWIPVWIDQLLQDVRYALRMLRRSPGFGAVVVLTLAIGIGMNTAVFSVVNAVLMRPLSYPHPERVVWLATLDAHTKDEFVTSLDFLGWRDAVSLEHIAAFDAYADRVATGDTVIAEARIATVSDGFWELAGARPAIGRVPVPGEAGVLLSHAFYQTRFKADSGIVGKAMTIGERQVTVLGVLPPGFHVQLPSPAAWAGLEPRAIDVYRAFVVRPPVNGRIALFKVLGTLKPGVSIETARAELETIGARVASENPGMPLKRTVRVMTLADRLVGGARAALLILLAAVVLVLLIACANIANLLLARASARQKEIAIRAAVGAGRGRVLRQFLVESLLLSAIGGSAGLLLARGGLLVMVRLVPQAVPRLTEATIDGRVLVFAIVMSVVTALLFGVGPAVTLWRTNAYDVLKDGTRTASATPGSLRMRTMLVAAELGLTVVLLCGAGLLVKSVWRMSAYPPGFDPEHTLSMKVQFSGPQFGEKERRAYVDEALRRVAGVPGVEAAGMSTNAGGRMRLFIQGVAMPDMERPIVLESSVSAGYAKAIGMRIIAGRWVTDAEPAQVFVINESLARREFHGQNPIGRRIQSSGPPGDPDAMSAEIVGVVADLKYTKLDATPEPEIFTDYAHASPFSATIVARTAGDPLAVAPAIRTLVAAIDKTQTVSDVKTVAGVLADSIAPRRFNMFLLGSFAAAALLLALIGIYGVIAYAVAQRTREIGVRMALGAQRGEVVRLVVRQGLGMALAGMVAGALAALVLTRLMTSLLYDVTPTDPGTFAVVIGVLATTALAACCGPALRAARVDPMIALRCE
jgi:predicted permease